MDIRKVLKKTFPTLSNVLEQGDASIFFPSLTPNVSLILCYENGIPEQNSRLKGLIVN